MWVIKSDQKTRKVGQHSLMTPWKTFFICPKELESNISKKLVDWRRVSSLCCFQNSKVNGKYEV